MKPIDFGDSMTFPIYHHHEVDIFAFVSTSTGWISMKFSRHFRNRYFQTWANENKNICIAKYEKSKVKKNYYFVFFLHFGKLSFTFLDCAANVKQ